MVLDPGTKAILACCLLPLKKTNLLSIRRVDGATGDLAVVRAALLSLESVTDHLELVLTVTMSQEAKKTINQVVVVVLDLDLVQGVAGNLQVDPDHMMTTMTGVRHQEAVLDQGVGGDLVQVGKEGLEVDPHQVGTTMTDGREAPVDSLQEEDDRGIVVAVDLLLTEVEMANPIRRVDLSREGPKTRTILDHTKLVMDGRNQEAVSDQGVAEDLVLDLVQGVTGGLQVDPDQMMTTMTGVRRQEAVSGLGVAGDLVLDLVQGVIGGLEVESHQMETTMTSVREAVGDPLQEEDVLEVVVDLLLMEAVMADPVREVHLSLEDLKTRTISDHMKLVIDDRSQEALPDQGVGEDPVQAVTGGLQLHPDQMETAMTFGREAAVAFHQEEDVRVLAMDLIRTEA